MLRGAPPAAGPTGTVGRARATLELHGTVRSGTVGRGPNRDHRPWTGRGGFASTHAHLGTAGRETILGIAGRTRAGGAARPGAGNYASTHAHLGTAGRETTLGIAGRTRAGGAARPGAGNYASSHDASAPPAARPFLGSRAAGGPEELRDSEWTYTSTHAHLGTAGRGTRKGTVGCGRAGGAA
jgi:hypothetical protein